MAVSARGALGLLFGRESKYSQEPLAFACCVALVFVWAGWYVVSRWGVNGNMTPADISLVRYVTGTVITLPLFWFWRGRKINWKALCVLVPSYGFPYVLTLFLGLTDAPAANAGVLVNGLLPIVNATLAWFVFKHGMGLGKWVAIGLLASANGCMLFAGLHDDSLSPVWLWFVFSTVSLSIYMTYFRLHPIDVLVIIPAMSLGNLLLFLLFMAILPADFRMEFLPFNLGEAHLHEIVVQAVFQGLINQVLVIWMIAYMLPRLGSVSTSMMYGFAPAVTALLGWLALGEALTPLEIVGIIGCCAGIIMFSRSV